jgi:hypothetical protein
MATRAPKLTKANITRVLTRGGLPKSEWVSSRSGDWTREGFCADDRFLPGQLVVRYTPVNHHYPCGEVQRAALVDAQLAKAEPLLHAAGWTTRRDGEVLVVTEPAIVAERIELTAEQRRDLTTGVRSIPGPEKSE